MKDFKDLNELKEVFSNWIKDNPLIEDFTINGVKPELSFNVIFTIDPDGDGIQILSASRAYNITDKELALHNFNQIDKIIQWSNKHINSSN